MRYLEGHRGERIGFAVGAALPLALVLALPMATVAVGVVVSTLVALVALVVLGSVAAVLGGASVTRGALRVAFWGAVAMGGTTVVGRWFGAPVG